MAPSLHHSRSPLIVSMWLQGFLSLRGSGYRPERKGYPLNNTWRQTCDSLSRPCVVVCLDLLGSNDTMVVDMATLRIPQGDLLEQRIPQGDLLEQRKQEITDLAGESLPSPRLASFHSLCSTHYECTSYTLNKLLKSVSHCSQSRRAAD